MPPPCIHSETDQLHATSCDLALYRTGCLIPIDPHHFPTKAHQGTVKKRRCFLGAMADKTKTVSLLTELGVEDLYGFLGVQPDGTEKEVND